MMKTSANPHGMRPAATSRPYPVVRTSVADMTDPARSRLLIHVDEGAGESARIELPQRGLPRGRAEPGPEWRIAGEPCEASCQSIDVSRHVGQRVHAVR